MTNTAAAVADQNETVIADELAADQGIYGMYEIAKLRASPDNRKRFNEQALQELAASIKAMGVAQPILVRPVTPTAEAPEEFEIVAGERRFRASKIAGKTQIPALCRKLSDLDAAKIRILENLQREDPHPMEEAEGYQLLMLQHGFTADQLVDEVKKSRAYIYARLKLCALTTDVREQFLEDKIPASTALLIARIPVPALQVRALGEILKPPAWMGSDPMSYRQAVQHIQQNYMLDLGNAVFKIGDAKLLIAAGSCLTCPKRTGNQPEVFAGVSANVCTDPDCFNEKRAAHYAALTVKANKQGIPVLEWDEGQKILPHTWSSDSELVPASHGLYTFARNAPSTKNNGSPKDYLDEKSLPPVARYVKRQDGSLTALYERTAMQAALEAAGVCETVEAHAKRMAELEAAPSNQAAQSAAQKKRDAEQAEHRALEEKAKRETSFRVELYKRLRRRASSGFCLQSLRELTKLALDGHHLPDDLLGDEYGFKASSDAAVTEYIDQAGLAEVQLLLIDLLVGETLSVGYWDVRRDEYLQDSFQSVAAMARHEGIDPDAVREELFPSPIDVTPMQHGDLVDFITRYPHRLDELTKIIMAHPRGELTGMLEKAAQSLGYTWAGKAWISNTKSVVADQVEDTAPVEATPTSKDATSTAAPKALKVNATTPASKKAKTAAAEPAPAAAFDLSPWPFPKSSDAASNAPKTSRKKAPASEVAA